MSAIAAILKHKEEKCCEGEQRISGLLSPLSACSSNLYCTLQGERFLIMQSFLKRKNLKVRLLKGQGFCMVTKEELHKLLSGPDNQIIDISESGWLGT